MFEGNENTNGDVFFKNLQIFYEYSARFPFLGKTNCNMAINHLKKGLMHAFTNIKMKLLHLKINE
jgi:hypothetical protein